MCLLLLARDDACTGTFEVICFLQELFDAETDRHCVSADAEEQNKREPTSSAGSPGDKVPSKMSKECNEASNAET